MSGHFVTVTGVHPQGIVPFFRFRFSDAATLLACADHFGGASPRLDQAALLTTYEGIDHTRRYNLRRSPLKLRVSMVKPVDGRTIRFRLILYLLGVWLGDGTSTAAAITTMDPEIVDAIRDAATGSARAPIGTLVDYDVHRPTILV